MSNLVRIHLAKVQGSIPQAKGCTRRRSNDPVGLVSLYVCSSLFSVTSAAEVPWSTIRLHSAEVKCIEALEVERPTTVLSLFAYGPASIHLQQCHSGFVNFLPLLQSDSLEEIESRIFRDACKPKSVNHLTVNIFSVHEIFILVISLGTVSFRKVDFSVGKLIKRYEIFK